MIRDKEVVTGSDADTEGSVCEELDQDNIMTAKVQDVSAIMENEVPKQNLHKEKQNGNYNTDRLSVDVIDGIGTYLFTNKYTNLSLNIFTFIICSF